MGLWIITMKLYTNCEIHSKLQVQWRILAIYFVFYYQIPWQKCFSIIFCKKKIFNRFVNSFPIWNIWFSFDFEARCVRQARNSPYSLFHKTKYNTNKPCNSFNSIINHIYLHYRNSKRITKENWSKKAERYLFKHNLSTHIVWCAVHIQLISKRFVI